MNPQGSIQATAGDQPCGGRALCGWSPPSLPADTSLKRRVDHIRIGNPAAIGVLVVVIGFLNLVPHLPLRASLATDGLAALPVAAGARSTSGGAAMRTVS